MKVYDYEKRRNISGERVRERRLHLRLSQSVLAAKLQTEGIIIERDAITRIEMGARMVQDYELRALASALGVTADWLIDLDK